MCDSVTLGSWLRVGDKADRNVVVVIVVALSDR